MNKLVKAILVIAITAALLMVPLSIFSSQHNAIETDKTSSSLVSETFPLVSANGCEHPCYWDPILKMCMAPGGGTGCGG